MMRLSISNLAWPNTRVDDVAPELKASGVDGVEMAPTAIWPDAPNVPFDQVRAYGRRWHAHGLAVSGIQSLLYGHPEMQVFDRASWPILRSHLAAMIHLANELNTQIAVFGSPKNRVRGGLTQVEANEVCAEFLSGLLPVLAQYGVVLTLEPNAPAYGADYLIRYADAVALSDLVGSPWVQPQVDTGCLSMVDDPVEQAIYGRLPAHVHISTPSLLPPPGPINHQVVRRSLVSSRYEGWVVLEMIQTSTQPLEAAARSARWLTETYGSIRRDHGNH